MTTMNPNLVDGKYAIGDLLDLERLRLIFEKFTQATGFTIGFLDHPEMNILIATGWRDICTVFHRSCPISAAVCTKSNAHLLNQLTEPGLLSIEACDNGLVDCATPIIIKGVHIASLATGQLLLHEPDIERFKQQARDYGFDEESYLKALAEIPVVTEEKLRDVTSFLWEIAFIMSELGYTNLKIKEETEQLAKEITERKRVERELRDYREHLEELVSLRTAELEKANADLNAFSYSVSHDLKAPLRIIEGFSQKLLKKYGNVLDEEGQDYLERICRRTERMGKLIDDLLAFSRLSRQEMVLSEVDMTAIVRGLFAELVEAQAPNRVVRLQLCELPPAHVDASMIAHVWTNLLSNALKFTRSRVEAIIEVGSYAENNEQVYFIKDNGVGFDMNYVDRIFGVFQRLHTEQEFEGTGIGLSLVQQIISRHHGRVWAEGEIDKGAAFYFTLPE